MNRDKYTDYSYCTSCVEFRLKVTGLEHISSVKSIKSEHFPADYVSAVLTDPMLVPEHMGLASCEISMSSLFDCGSLLKM